MKEDNRNHIPSESDFIKTKEDVLAEQGLLYEDEKSKVTTENSQSLVNDNTDMTIKEGEFKTEEFRVAKGDFSGDEGIMDEEEIADLYRNKRKYESNFKSDRIIEIKGATKNYGKGRGIFDINMTIKKGEVVGFLGPNGAGKTTTIRAITAFIKLDKGHITVEGMHAFNNRHRINDFLGYVPSDVAFFEEMNGDKFLNYIADIRDLESMQTANELIEEFELDTSLKIKKMSKGNKQKLAIVNAMLHDPDVIVFDEPTTGLDPIMQKKFVDLIARLKQEGKTIFISSHIFDEVAKTCDKVAIIKEGRLVAFEDISEIRKNKVKVFDIQFKYEKDAIDFESSVEGAIRQGANIEYRMQGEVTRLLSKLSNYSIIDIDVHKINLEELFLQYFGGEADE